MNGKEIEMLIQKLDRWTKAEVLREEDAQTDYAKGLAMGSVIASRAIRDMLIRQLRRMEMKHE